MRPSARGDSIQAQNIGQAGLTSQQAPADQQGCCALRCAQQVGGALQKGQAGERRCLHTTPSSLQACLEPLTSCACYSKTLVSVLHLRHCSVQACQLFCAHCITPALPAVTESDLANKEMLAVKWACISKRGAPGLCAEQPGW